MDLSTDIENLHDFNKLQENISKENCSRMHDSSGILDLSTLNLDNEETWLYEPRHVSSVNTQDWLYGKCDIPTTSELPPDFIVPKLKSSKTIDTRTFTRPKKKFTRPSINDYEQLYLSRCDGIDVNCASDNNHSPKWPQTLKEEQESAADVPVQPLHFDLSQPTSLHNFDSFIINSADIDSFQNMSPPSLVNSLCSSTFANLMESSFIKNDPVLREIRDKDFTETALLQDTEAPMFQSITESCSSLNSDSPESFLKKVSFNGTFRRNISDNNATMVQSSENSTGNNAGNNATFEVNNVNVGSHTDNKNSTYPIDTTPQSTEDTHHITKSNQLSLGNVNGTYRRTPKANGTFRKSDLKNNRLSLNLTYEMPKDINVLDRDVSKSIENDMNNSNKGSTIDTKSSSRTVILRSDSIENLKKRYSTSDLNMDLNRLSYCMEEQDNQMNATYKEDKVHSELNRTVEIKSFPRSSLGSADSLDRMSSLSSSSKGSNKVLSIEDVEAIVEMQERSLSQVMSTPKPNGGRKKLWENNFISPIVADAKDRLSDSELSDDYKSVKSQVSSKASLETWKKPTAKSLGYLAANKDLKLKTSQKSTYTTASQRPLQALPNNIRGSYSNISSLKTTSSGIGGSHSNLFRPSSNMIRPPSTSNLKSMGSKLKGSYTSLRPISANLPVVPPIGSTIHQTVTRRGAVNVTRSADTVKVEVPPVVTKEKIVVSAPAESTFVKPQNLRTSGLPRPTGIPRPASRIPAPRSSNIRPSSSRNVNY